MYVYHLFVLPIVLEEEYIGQLGSMYAHHHIILHEPHVSQPSTHMAMECVLENGEMTGPAVLKYRQYGSLSQAECCGSCDCFRVKVK